MIKIYHLSNCLTLGLREDFRDLNSLDIISSDEYLEPTNLAFFFAKSKNIAIIFESQAQLNTYLDILSKNFKLIRAGGGIVSNKQGDTLMIFRNGRWDLPKGKMEQNESIETCALREVEEECGIDSGLTLGQFIHDSYHIYSINHEMVLKRTSWYEMTLDQECSFTPQTIEGITRVKWVAPKELVCYMAETYPTIQDVLMARFNKHNQ